MATQKCPRCSSDRVRQGYRATSIFQKIMFRYNLLCDNCNWEFVGFAVPGTVTTKVKRKPKNTNIEAVNSTNKNELTQQNTNWESDNIVISNGVDYIASSETETIENEFNSEQSDNRNKNKVKKRVRVKLT